MFAVYNSILLSHGPAKNRSPVPKHCQDCESLLSISQITLARYPEEIIQYVPSRSGFDYEEVVAVRFLSTLWTDQRDPSFLVSSLFLLINLPATLGTYQMLIFLDQILRQQFLPAFWT